MPRTEFDAAGVVRWMNTAADAVDREAGRLTELDSPIGDADHGTNMRRGFTAVRTELATDSPGTPGGVLLLSGRVLVSRVGGAAGPLYGTLLRRTGKALGNAEEVDGKALAAALRTGVEAVAQLGGAGPGDKTMLDALLPAVAALEQAVSGGGDEGGGAGGGTGAGLEAALDAARDAAEKGAAATVPLRARKGRASYLGERSVGHQDPGASSAALLMAALAEAAADD